MRSLQKAAMTGIRLDSVIPGASCKNGDTEAVENLYQEFGIVYGLLDEKIQGVCKLLGHQFGIQRESKPILPIRSTEHGPNLARNWSRHFQPSTFNQLKYGRMRQRFVLRNGPSAPCQIRQTFSRCNAVAGVASAPITEIAFLRRNSPEQSTPLWAT